MTAFLFDPPIIEPMVDARHAARCFNQPLYYCAMTISTEQTRRLDDDEKGVSSIHTPGGQQYQPLYYCTKPQHRIYRHIPFYRLGRTIRFRLSEPDERAAHYRQNISQGIQP